MSLVPPTIAASDAPPFLGDGLTAAREASTRGTEAAPPMTLERFDQLLSESGLLLPDELATLRSSMPLYATVEAFAESIYRQGKLTKYQLTRVVQGKAKSLFLGNYVVLDKIGQGGMGLVVKARHRVMQRIVAIKLLSPVTMKSTDSIRRFHREVEAAARLNHPNIVAAFDADQANGTHFLVMEFVDGCNLAHLVRMQGALSIKRTIEFLLQAGRGLEYAHAHGIIHRDIKPGNLLVDRSGVVKILDLGLARQQNDDQASDLTGSGQIMGTIDYMAPEQAVQTRLADQRSDIYSFGCTLWFLLTGHSVFDGETALAKLLNHRDTPIPPLLGTSPELAYTNPRAVAVDRVLRKMLAKRPEDRYQSMAEVLIDLEGCLTGRMPAATPKTDGPPESQELLADFLTYLAQGEDSRRPLPATVQAENRNLDLSQLSSDSQQFTLNSKPDSARPAGGALPRNRPPSKLWFSVGIAVAGVLLLIILIASQRPRRAQATTTPTTPSSILDTKSNQHVPSATSKNETRSGDDSNSESGWEQSLAREPRFQSGGGARPVRSFQLAFDGISNYAVVDSLKYDPEKDYTIEGWLTLVGERLQPVDPMIWAGPRWIAIWEQYRRFGIAATGTGESQIFSSSYSASMTVPVHVAGIWTKSELVLYVDGRRVMTSDTKSSPFAGTSGGFFLGGAPQQNLHHERWFRGGIDEVRISRGSRYRMKNFLPLRRFPEKDPDTLALYHMDEGEGEKLKDSSGQGHHGKIFGAKWIIEPRDGAFPSRK